MLHADTSSSWLKFTADELNGDPIFFYDSQQQASLDAQYRRVKMAIYTAHETAKANGSTVTQCDIACDEHPNGYLRDRLKNEGFAMKIIYKQIKDCDCDFGCKGHCAVYPRAYYAISWETKRGT